MSFRHSVPKYHSIAALPAVNSKG